MPATDRVPQDYKEFDARSADLVVGGSDEIEDLESVGFDQSKDHDLQRTIDQNAIWVKANPELTGSFVLKATSPSIVTVEEMWAADEVFDLNIELADTAYGEEVSSVGFVGCMITDINHSDYQVDDMPTVSVEFEAVNQSEG